MNNSKSVVIPFTTKQLSLCVKVRVVSSGVRPEHGSQIHTESIWIGRFLSEESRDGWRTRLDTAFEGQGKIECLNIHAYTLGRRTFKKVTYDIDPERCTPENALLAMPQIILDKIMSAGVR